MKLTIPQPQLAAAIARGSAAAAKRSPLDILTHMRLSADDSALTIASSDNDRFVETVAICQVDEPGAVCVDASAFKTLIGKYPKSGVVTLEIEDGRLLVKCGRSRVKMPVLPAEDFPAWADDAPEAEFRLGADDFFRAFKRVRFAAANTGPLNPALQGVYLDYHDGRLHFAATDKNRLSVSGIVAPDGAENCPHVIVPTEAVDAALSVFTEAAAIDVRVNKRAIGFSMDGLRLSSRLIDGVFPPYEKFIPARGNPGIVVKKSEFVDALDRVTLMLGEGEFSGVVARHTGETLALSARNHKGGEASEELPVAALGGDMEPFAFNPRYAAQFLSTLNVKELAIEHEGGQKPILIYSDDAPDFVGMLGPMTVAL